MRLQLKKSVSIRDALTLATCSLLGAQSTVVSAEEDDVDWIFDSAVLDYAEKGRVQVFEPVISLKKNYQIDESVDYRFVFDSMTGASPNGATPTDSVQVFTGASGQSGYSVPANQTPQREFTDQRVAVSFTSQKPIDRLRRRINGGAISVEKDYISFGLNTSYMKDINNKLTTLTAGVGVNLDLVMPSGGAPEALVNVNAPTQEGEGDDDDDEGEGGEDDAELKTIVDLLFGITQIVNSHTLMQFNYSRGFINGYLTDPYKVVSVVNGVTGEPAITPGTPEGTMLNVYYNEKRPDTRNTNSIFWKTVYQIGDDVIRVAYRYFWDDWAINSHTIDFQYRLELGRNFYIQPHYRYYTQTAADFYRHSIVEGPKPEYVSADFRLGEFVSRTIGLKIGMVTSGKSNFNIRVERFEQTGDSYPQNAIGVQKNFDLYPTLVATTVQIAYSIKF